MKIKHIKQKCRLNFYVFQQQLQTVFQLHNYVQYYKYLFHKMYFKVTLYINNAKEQNFCNFHFGAPPDPYVLSQLIYNSISLLETLGRTLEIAVWKSSIVTART